MAWTDVFGGQTINPQNISYAAYSFATNATFLWPTTSASGNVVTDIMDITTTVANLTLTMPDARRAGAGQATLIYNAGAETFSVVTATGVAIQSIAPGEGWYIWMRDNSTESGQWRVIEFGAGTSSASAAALASATVKASGSALVQAMPVFSISSDYTAGPGERGKLINWTGGAGTLTLTVAGAVGDDWFCAVRNSGSGALTIARSGSDTISGETSITLNPDESTFLVCDGSGYFTVSRTQAPEDDFTRTSISVAGTGDFTLSSGQLGFSSYVFTGALTGNRNIIVPATVAPYRVTNDTTGSFTLTVKTASGTGVAVAQGEGKFLVCDGTNVIDQVTAGISTPVAISDGGTGATTASAARTNLGATSVGNAVFTAADASGARTAIGATATGSAVFIAADAAAARTAIGTVIGTDVQAYDAGLQSISGLTTAADKMIYTTASDTYAVTDLTAAGRAILDDADAAAQRTTLGLVIGTDVQAYDAALASLAGLSLASGDILYATGADALARLAVGSNGQFLTLSSGVPAWANAPTSAFTKSYESAEQTITSGGALTLAHGLGSEPLLLQVYLVCKTSEANYSVNDKVLIGNHLGSVDNTSRGVSIVPDATNLNIRYGLNSGVFQIVDKSTGGVSTSFTNSRWRMVVRAWA